MVNLIEVGGKGNWTNMTRPDDDGHPTMPTPGSNIGQPDYMLAVASREAEGAGRARVVSAAIAEFSRSADLDQRGTVRWLASRAALCLHRCRQSHLTAAGRLMLGSFLGLMSWSTLAVADDYYAAIAFSQRSGNYGYSNDYGTRRSAEREALERCGGDDCTVVLWFRNACGALATGDDNGYGTGWATTRGEAEEIATSSCNEQAENCSVIRCVCTTR
jgi:hypothetical protein